MTPVQTLYRWFNDNPEATYKEALEAYEHCLELEQQLPQQEISHEEIQAEAIKRSSKYQDSALFENTWEEAIEWYKEKLQLLK
jgi:hypothetical protein